MIFMGLLTVRVGKEGLRRCKFLSPKIEVEEVVRVLSSCKIVTRSTRVLRLDGTVTQDKLNGEWLIGNMNPH